MKIKLTFPLKFHEISINKTSVSVNSFLYEIYIEIIKQLIKLKNCILKKSLTQIFLFNIF